MPMGQRTWIVGVLSIMLVSGCAGMQGRIPRDSEIHSVKSPDGNSESLGLPPENKMEFEDRRIKAKFELWSKQFSVALTNRSKSPIRILWDEAAYIDENENSHPIRHRGEHSSRASATQASTLIEPGGTLVDLVAPADREYLIDRSSPLTRQPNGSVRSYGNKIDGMNASRDGVFVGLYLPVAVNNTVEPYVFRFFVVGDP